MIGLSVPLVSGRGVQQLEGRVGSSRSSVSAQRAPPIPTLTLSALAFLLRQLRATTARPTVGQTHPSFGERGCKTRRDEYLPENLAIS